MSFLNFVRRSKLNYTPANYEVNEVATILSAGVGDLVGCAFARIRVAFDGTSPAAELGDDGDVDRFITTTNMGVATLGLKRGTGAGFTETMGYLYTTANTIDVNFTAATGSPTVGTLDTWLYIARVNPY